MKRHSILHNNRKRNQPMAFTIIITRDSQIRITMCDSSMLIRMSVIKRMEKTNEKLRCGEIAICIHYW
jgi:hypothetical protein